jgi:hypothetical protein
MIPATARYQLASCVPRIPRIPRTVVLMVRKKLFGQTAAEQRSGQPSQLRSCRSRNSRQEARRRRPPLVLGSKPVLGIRCGLLAHVTTPIRVWSLRAALPLTSTAIGPAIMIVYAAVAPPWGVAGPRAAWTRTAHDPMIDAASHAGRRDDPAGHGLAPVRDQQAHGGGMASAPLVGFIVPAAPQTGPEGKGAGTYGRGDACLPPERGGSTLGDCRCRAYGRHKAARGRWPWL